MCNGRKGTHIVVNNHSTGIYTRTDTIVENQRYTLIYECLEMVVFGCILRLRDDDATDLTLRKRSTDFYFVLIVLSTLCNHNSIAT